jgi:transposase
VTAVACGIDWAQDHHDVALVDETGVVVASVRIDDNAAGLGEVLALLAEHDRDGQRPPVAIETTQGLLVAGLQAAGRQVFVINPLAVSRYRDRYRSSRGKSDAFDAMVLANILRTDMPAHRPLPQDSELLRSLRVLTRAQQDAGWDQVTLTNRVRALLRMFFPAAVAAFERGGRHRLDSAAARTILTAAPTPAAAGGLGVAELAVLLRQAGRQRGVAAEAAKLQALLSSEQMRQPTAVEEAMGLQLLGLLRQLDAVCQTLEHLERRIDEVFTAHPDAKIVTSVPGLGVQLGARLLAEIGDDRNRFADARSLRAFAGASPVTRASGKSSFVRARRAKNDRIAATGYVWALAAVRHDRLWDARYRTRRQAGDRHVAALRRLFHLMLGKLHHCLQQNVLYDPDKAFAEPVALAA